MTTLIWIAVGAIVLLALVVVLRRLARDNEPVARVLCNRGCCDLTDFHPDERALIEDEGPYTPRSKSPLNAPPSWHETERLRKKHREQERARKRRQKNRKGGR